MFCASCGSAINSGDKYCASCGKEATQSPIAKKTSESRVSANTVVSDLRHPKEEVYFTLGAIIGAIGWLALFWIVLLFIWIALPVFIGLWVTEQFFRARFLGEAVRVGPDQYPEIHEIILNQSQRLGLAAVPDIFVVNQNGLINALALKFLRTKYVILFSDLVDVMLAHDSTKELSFVIGHELGHHAAGHTALWKELLLRPTMILPFFGPAYSRACELTADRIGTYLCGDKETACRSLITLACGSRVLSPRTNLAAFEDQEKHLSPLFAFLHDLYSTHPRTTKRVIEVREGTPIKTTGGIA